MTDRIHPAKPEEAQAEGQLKLYIETTQGFPKLPQNFLEKRCNEHVRIS